MNVSKLRGVESTSVASLTATTVDAVTDFVLFVAFSGGTLCHLRAYVVNYGIVESEDAYLQR